MVSWCRAAVAKDWSGITRLGQMGLSLIKAVVDRQACGTMDPAQGRRRGAKAHRKMDSEGPQHPMIRAEQRSRLSRYGRYGRLCAQRPTAVDALDWCSEDEQPERM